MKRLRLVLAALVLMLPQAVAAQEPLFEDYAALRATLDPLMKNRDIAEVMLAFGASDEQTPEDLEQLEYRVRTIFPRDFENVALVRKQELSSGFRQELIAFWQGYNYIYVYLLLQEREDGLLSLAMNFNTEFDDLFAKF